MVADLVTAHGLVAKLRMRRVMHQLHLRRLPLPAKGGALRTHRAPKAPPLTWFNFVKPHLMLPHFTKNYSCKNYNVIR